MTAFADSAALGAKAGWRSSGDGERDAGSLRRSLNGIETATAVHRADSGSGSGAGAPSSKASSGSGSGAKRSNTDKQTHGNELSRSSVDTRILDARMRLPIWIARDAIADAVKQHDTVVILGETGSGKTTQIPQFLYEGGLATAPHAAVESGLQRKRVLGRGSGRPYQMIGITQPRRVAAISLAKRVATEMGVHEPGRDGDGMGAGSSSARGGGGGAQALVGYSVRFDDRTSSDTRIKFMTDGWLLRELLAGEHTTGKGVGTNKGKRKADSEGTSLLSSASVSSNQSYSLLEQYSVLIIDEAHERSVHTDVVLGLVKRVQRERKRRRQIWLRQRGKRLSEQSGAGHNEGQAGGVDDEVEPTELKIVVMSATIDADKFARFFTTAQGSPAPILYIKGRQFPIKMLHSAAACTDWVESCKKLIVQLSTQPPGDVLIFMTGAEEIESFATEISELSKGLHMYAEGMGQPPPLDLVVVKLYAALGGEAIRKCFSTTPPHSRKIVLATNIAETSITISGIKYVIDCGLAKERTFQSSMVNEQQGGPTQAVPGASLEMLSVKPISKAAARQRAGRAGRESGGSCFRLYTEETFDSLEESTQPEILRTDLSSVVLDVFAMGLDPLSFDWLDRPDDEGIKAAVLNLTELGALELVQVSSANGSHDSDLERHGRENGKSSSRKPLPVLRLTTLGYEMSKLPLLPALSKTLLTARDYNVGDEELHVVFMQALDLVSILSTERRSILVEPAARGDDDRSGSGGRRRLEADRARERLAHSSGDHATQLQALEAFEEMQASCRQPQHSVASNGSNSLQQTQSPGRSLDLARLKEWCNTNYVSLKAVREATRIRTQLLQVCRRQGWAPSGALDKHDKAHVQPRRNRGSGVPLSGSEAEIASEEEAETDDDMIVTRGSRPSLMTEGGSVPASDYAALRRCLVTGKRLNTAFREGQSAMYQRAHGGQTRFRIHPSSSLLFTAKAIAANQDGGGGNSGGDAAQQQQQKQQGRNHHPNARLPTVIYFEDMVYTSQLFARTVSAAEASWLADINTEVRTRRHVTSSAAASSAKA